MQRAVILQVCCVCNKRFINKAALEDHTSAVHGVHWHPAVLKRVDDDMEFRGKPRKAATSNHVPWPVGFGS